MITQHSFSIDWINQVSKRYKADKILVEKSIRQVSSHIFSEPFHIEEAILSAAKAYYIAALIETDGITIEKYSGRQLERMRDWLLTDYEYTKLNKIKKSNPEAFFYLYLTLHR